MTEARQNRARTAAMWLCAASLAAAPARGDVPALPPGVLAVPDARGHVAYLLACPAGGFLAIDSGSEAGAPALTQALAAHGATPADVHAVLLTAGLPAQRGGAAALGQGPVFVGIEDWALASHRRQPRALWPRLAARLRPAPPAPAARLHTVAPGATLPLCGLTVRAIALPSHTAGSRGYLVGDLIFAGDAVRAIAGRGAAPSCGHDEQPAFAPRLAERLARLGCRQLADGRGGLAPCPAAPAA